MCYRTCSLPTVIQERLRLQHEWGRHMRPKCQVLLHEPEEYEVVEETSVLFSEFSTGPKLYFVCK